MRSKWFEAQWKQEIQAFKSYDRHGPEIEEFVFEPDIDPKMLLTGEDKMEARNLIKRVRRDHVPFILRAYNEAFKAELSQMPTYLVEELQEKTSTKYICVSMETIKLDDCVNC